MLTLAAFFFVMFFTDGGKHYFSAVLTLAVNQKLITSFDNYFIILIIALVSFSPELRIVRIKDYEVSKIFFGLFIKALIGLFIASWYFGYISPFSDFKVGTMILEWFKTTGLGFLEYIKKTVLGFIW